MKYVIKTDTILSGWLEVSLEFAEAISDENDYNLKKIINLDYSVFDFYEVKDMVEAIIIGEGLERMFNVKDVSVMYFKSINHAFFFLKRKLTENEKEIIKQTQKQYSL